MSWVSGADYTEAARNQAWLRLRTHFLVKKSEQSLLMRTFEEHPLHKNRDKVTVFVVKVMVKKCLEQWLSPGPCIRVTRGLPARLQDF